MKTVLDKLSNEQARKEVDTYTKWLLIVSIITFFIFWPIAYGVVMLGFRNFLLTYHKGNRKRDDITRLRIMSGSALVISIATIAINTIYR